MKSLTTSLLLGLLTTIGLFWLMQYMLLSHPERVKKSEHLNMMEFVRLIKEPPPPKPKPPQEKKVEKVQEVKEESGSPKPEPKKHIAPKKQPPKVEKVVQKVVHKAEPPPVPIPVPKFDMPKFDLPKTNLPNATGAVVKAPPPSSGTGTGTSTGKGSPTGTGTGSTAGNGKGTGTGTGTGHGTSSGVVPIVRVPPRYPSSAANRHIEGWVKVEFTITTVGSVTNARVVAAEPEDIFDDAALAAISQWKFREKIVDGQAVTQRAVQTLRFKLTN